MSPIEIVLDEFQPTYFPGSKISGNVIIEPNYRDSIKVDEINIKLIGETIVNFQYDFKPTSNFNPTKQYPCKNEIILWKPKNDEKYEAFSGESKFPFSMIFPENCPPSVKGENGKTDYYLEAEMKIPKFLGLTHGSETAKIDLNVGFPPMDPQILTLYKIEKCLTREYRGLKVVVSIVATAFTLGEIIPLSVHIANSDEKKSFNIKTALIGIVSTRNTDKTTAITFTNLQMTKSVWKNHFAEESSFDINENEAAKFDQQILIPNDLLPSFGENSILKLEYILSTKVFSAHDPKDAMKFIFSIIVLPNIA